MAAIDLFSPIATTAVSVSASTASGALTMPTTPANPTVRVYNSTAVVVFIKFGTSTVTAATTDTPIPAGGVEAFSINPNVTHIAGITASGTGTLYATTGFGS